MRFLSSSLFNCFAICALCTTFLSNKGTVFAADAAEDAPTAPVIPSGAESFAFEAEVSRMMDIVVNSLYQNKDVFLRELISNASDALDKIRYLLLTDDNFKSKEEIPLEVKIEYNAEEQTLTIRDTGVGMTKEDLQKNLGTVARSGTTKFLEALQENGKEAVSQIGQFGVGFYSSFLVADRVTVSSKHPLSDAQYVWQSENAASNFVIYKDPRGDTLQRGTEITLHLKDDALEYAEASKLKELATHYSEFVTHPISLRTTETMEVEVEDDETDEAEEKKEEDEKNEDGDLEVEDTTDDDEEEKPKKTKEVTTHSWDVLNSNQAIWTREKDSIQDDEYQSFYTDVLSHGGANATSWSHFNAEGNINFKALLYLPSEVPMSYRYGNMETEKGTTRLYVRKVLIGDEFELLPKYLGFIPGVVDSDDLPLNVNRETLQESKILTIIKKKLVRKAIEMIRNFAKDNEEIEEAEAEVDEEGNVKEAEPKESKYHEWYRKFSPNLKLGCLDDEPNKDKLMKLLRFETSKSDGKLISLASYVENTAEWQDDIYVLGGSSKEEIEKSPLLESFTEKNLEVVYMTDALDEYLVKQVRDFDGKKFVQISSENIKFKDEDADLVKRREKAYRNQYKPLTKWLRKLFSGSVMRVQIAKRNLGSVPAVVTSSDYGNSANMERILRAQAFQHGADPMGMMSMKNFELNPRHPLVVKLLEGCPPEEEEGDDKTEVKVDPEVLDAAWMLHDMAMIGGGYPLSDSKAHSERMIKVMQKQFGLDSLALEPEIDPPVEEESPDEDEGAGGINDLDLENLDLDNLDLGV